MDREDAGPREAHPRTCTVLARKTAAPDAPCSCFIDNLCSIDASDGKPLEYPHVQLGYEAVPPVDWDTYAEEAREEYDTAHELSVKAGPLVEPRIVARTLDSPPAPVKVKEAVVGKPTKASTPRTSIVGTLRRRFVTSRSRVHLRSRSCKPPQTEVVDRWVRDDVVVKPPRLVVEQLPDEVVGGLETPDHTRSPTATSSARRNDRRRVRSVDFCVSSPREDRAAEEPLDTPSTTYSEMMEWSKPTPRTPLATWLAARDLEHYEAPLARMGVKRLADLAYITDEDLINMNMSDEARAHFHINVVA